VTVAPDALFISQGLLEGLADGDAHVFYRVVKVDVGVSLGLHRQIKESMFGKGLEHVVEEGDGSVDLGSALAVEVELDRDLGLLGVAGHFGFSCLGRHRKEKAMGFQDTCQTGANFGFGFGAHRDDGTAK
jgi:hypothetical protein